MVQLTGQTCISALLKAQKTIRLHNGPTVPNGTLECRFNKTRVKTENEPM